MPDDPEKAQIEALDARIKAAKGETQKEPTFEDHHSQAQLAWRMVIELVAGVVIGFGIGYGLDSLFGTLPIFLVTFIFLGFAAGIKVMLRSAKELNAAPPGGAKAKDDADGG